MPPVKAWKFDDPRAPKYPDDYQIVKKVILQVTDLKSNHNKYYALELHQAKVKGKDAYRLFTHYGRTDDLETNPNAGQKECRYFATLGEAESAYDSLYRDKTSAKKGYQEVALASTKIGSEKARGTSSGELDEKTLKKMAAAKGKTSKVKAAKAPAVVASSKLPSPVQELVRYIYDEAKTSLTNRVQATITAHGIETPLGVLTIGQVEKGEKILAEAYDVFKKAKPGKKKNDLLEKLSGAFFTAIPHRIGRSRKDVQIAILDTLKEFEEKQETLQLMKDMLQVNGEHGSVLFDSKIDSEYEALQCRVGWVDPGSKEYKDLANYVLKSQVKTDHLKVKNIWTLKRDPEWKTFTRDLGNDQLLFHGSRIQNWVGIISRGLLLPRVVVTMGGDRTDEGWLGHGIYFGNAICTSFFYASPGKRKTCLIGVARVALGKPKQFYEITYGLTKPPAGYHSCHGVRCDFESDDGVESEFDDDEFVIYDNKQQRLEYLVEVAG